MNLNKLWDPTAFAFALVMTGWVLLWILSGVAITKYAAPLIPLPEMYATDEFRRFIGFAGGLIVSSFCLAYFQSRITPKD